MVGVGSGHRGELSAVDAREDAHLGRGGVRARARVGVRVRVRVRVTVSLPLPLTLTRR